MGQWAMGCAPAGRALGDEWIRTDLLLPTAHAPIAHRPCAHAPIAHAPMRPCAHRPAPTAQRPPHADLNLLIYLVHRDSSCGIAIHKKRGLRSAPPQFR